MNDTGEKIVFDCRHCGTMMQARPERAGKTVHCIRCHCAVRIPELPCPRSTPLNVVSDHVNPGERAVIDSVVMPSIKDVEIVTADGEVHHSAELHIHAPATSPLRRMSFPAGAGMLIAACVIASVITLLRLNSGPSHATAAPIIETKKSTTQPR